MVEYGVVFTVENNGVGGYDNNMQDLLANFCGSLTYLVLRAGFGGEKSPSRVIDRRGVRGRRRGPPRAWGNHSPKLSPFTTAHQKREYQNEAYMAFYLAD